MIKTRYWILLMALMLAGSVILSLSLLKTSPVGNVVEIIQDGKTIETVDLSEVKEKYSFTITFPDGSYNTVTVDENRICISDADCHDKTCVRQGWLTEKNGSLICLPHRLIIRFSSSDGLDGISR